MRKEQCSSVASMRAVACSNGWKYGQVGLEWCRVAKGSMDALGCVTSLWRTDVCLCVDVSNCSWDGGVDAAFLAQDCARRCMGF